MRLTRQEAAAFGLGTNGKPKADKKPKENPDSTAGKRTAFMLMCNANGLPMPVAEYKFHADRKWRFDFLFDGWLAVELQGWIWSGGRHSSHMARNQQSDESDQLAVAEHQKVSDAIAEGYTVMFATWDDVENGKLFAVLKKVLQ